MDTAYFHKLLNDKLKTLNDTEDTAQDAAKTVELDQSRVGRLSRMDAIQQQAMSQEQNRRRENLKKQIVTALKRIETEDYGYCLDCGEEINVKRLEINPATPLCINCADK